MAYYGKLILACAGSGKTTSIVRECLQNTESKIIVTYTIENYESIKSKFVEINGCVPSFVTVFTWYSFLLREYIRPYRNYLTEHKIKGVLMVQSQSNKKVGFKGKHYYISEDKNFESFYFTTENRVYTDMISKLAHRCLNINNNSVMKRLKLRASKFYFDEIQDLEGYDLELLKSMMENQIPILMVGDTRQKTYSTHHENKNSKYSSDIRGYMENECKDLCEIDSTSLNVSHRCNSDIITLASKIYPDFVESKSDQVYSVDHQGIFFIAQSDVESYLQKYKPVQLRDSKRTAINECYSFRNFGISKGLTFDRVLIFPTEKQANWVIQGALMDKEQTKSRLYVAITRAKYSVTFVLADNVFKKNREIVRYRITE